jgi:hypothetical protein
VTSLAVNLKTRFGMTWSLGAGIICLVATVAVCRSSNITGCMTQSTINSGMGSCQWENSGIMVEDCTQPVIHIVTKPAIGRKFGSHMSFGIIILNLVTGNTINGYFLITSTFVTIYTCNIMTSGEWK